MKPGVSEIGYPSARPQAGFAVCVLLVVVCLFVCSMIDVSLARDAMGPTAI